MTASLALLVSGGGRTLENLQSEIASGRLDARIALVIASRPGIGAIERASRLSLPHLVIPDVPPSRRSDMVLQALSELQADWVLMAGWLSLLPIPEWLEGRVLNIHPALLPAFGGKGFYGDRVHRAVHESGCRVSGCTVHFADAVYDRGPILVQEAVPLEPGDTPDTIAARVFEAEKRAYPAALRLLLSGRATWDDGRVLWL